MESSWPSGMMSCTATGLMAASAALILRAFSSYITMATRRPGCCRPTARTTSKLPMCAPIRKAPRPGGQHFLERLRAVHLDIKQVEAAIEQIDPVVDAGGEAVEMPKQFRRDAAPAPGTPQIGARSRRAAGAKSRKYRLMPNSTTRARRRPRRSEIQVITRSMAMLLRSGRCTHSAWRVCRIGRAHDAPSPGPSLRRQRRRWPPPARASHDLEAENARTRWRHNGGANPRRA